MEQAASPLCGEVRILITCRYPLLAGALAHVVSGVSRAAIVAAPPYDVVVADVWDGTIAEMSLRQIIRRTACTNVLVITVNATEDEALQMFRCGARAVLTWASSPADVLSALRRVACGGTFAPPHLVDALVGTVLGEAPAGRGNALSARERQVVRLIARGSTPPETARRLGISLKTVDTHRANALRKLRLRNNADLTRYAIRARLIALDEEPSEFSGDSDRYNSDGTVPARSL